MELQDSVTKLKGVGEKTAALFAKVGVSTIGGLLTHYPRFYEVCEAPVDCARIEDGGKYAVQARVLSVSDVKRYQKYQVITVLLESGGRRIEAVWFNMQFLRNYFRQGGQYVLRGVVRVRGSQRRMEQPEYYSLADYERLLGIMQPRYPLTEGLTQKTVARAVRQALDVSPLHLLEYLPENVVKGYGMPSEEDALRQIHFPEDEKQMRRARDRLVFDEFLLFILGIRRLKESREEQKNEMPMTETAEIARLMERLPYELTGAQKKVWREIASDLKGDHVMSRLIQGDVGSGKTILAALALILAGCNGCQGALMAPTEVLAKQHFRSMQELIREHCLPLKAVLLTGSMTAKERRAAYEEIKSGEAQIVVGTHALIQENVIYHRLGLVVTDEQHRFGVRQRKTLADKGAHPHVLVMSATPIPRTLAMILYGDLDISVIDELPANRLPVKNCVVDESCRPSAYRFIEKETKAGHQAYIICPMVEESDEMELENVTDYAEKLRQILPACQTACLHGRMKAAQKDEVMERFAKGQIQILASTTVIEVGINVPNATVMMVENAERFGLSQLHQLRGRVGRGSAQSYCIFMSGSKSEETRKRLEVLNASNDGFYIAGEDLKLRGPGDLFGIRQSGILAFRIGDVFQDSRILKLACRAADEILASDPGLHFPEHRMLARRLNGALDRDEDMAVL